jgi:hypothetical protein
MKRQYKQTSSIIGTKHVQFKTELLLT